MMKHEFLYYTKRERRAVMMLLAVIALLISGGLLLDEYMPEQGSSMFPQLSQEQCDSLYAVLDSFYHSGEDRPPHFSKNSKKKIHLFEFDPNRADSAEFIEMGLPWFVAKNILQYRRKGGVFRTAEKFGRIYGMRREDYLRVRPYIRIDTMLVRYITGDTLRKDTSKKYFRLSDSDSVLLRRGNKFAQPQCVEINGADTSVLRRIPGIGEGYSQMIISYRERLGGYYSIGQIREVITMEDSVYAAMSRWLRADTALIRKIDVNGASVGQMRKHPYLDFYKSKAIYEMRKERKRLNGMVQLRLLEEFTPADFERLRWYLEFK